MTITSKSKYSYNQVTTEILNSSYMQKKHAKLHIMKLLPFTPSGQEMIGSILQLYKFHQMLVYRYDPSAFRQPPNICTISSDLHLL